MLNKESKRQLEEAESLNNKPPYEISFEEARKQFSKTKEIFSLPEVEIKHIENKKIFCLNFQKGTK